MMTMLDELPHQVTSDNMGEPVTYWRQFRRTSDGECVIGTGHTKEQAVFDAECNYYRREEYLAKPPHEQLKILLAQKQLHDKEMNEAIKIIGELILAHIRGGDHGA